MKNGVAWAYPYMGTHAIFTVTVSRPLRRSRFIYHAVLVLFTVLKIKGVFFIKVFGNASQRCLPFVVYSTVSQYPQNGGR